MKVLGLIPARGGSMGIPHKNRKLLAGKPLLAYTIQAALGATLLDSIVFSSEDDKLIALARNLGVSNPFKRPEALATNEASSLAVVRHVVEELSKNGKKYDAVCLLQVTNPFRKSSFIDAAIAKFKTSGTDSLISVLRVPHQYNPHWVFEVSKEGTLEIATGAEHIIKRRQELPEAYCRDGAIYIVKTEVLLQQDSLYGRSIGYIESDASRHVNIDTLDDWAYAEELVTKLDL
jgi:CMP-N-acetylneuraminic acid synthetase